MSLIVEVFVNDRQIARAVARNKSNLADISNYEVDARLSASEFSPAEKHTSLEIKGHNRNQPVWSLIEKMMQVIQDKAKPKLYVVGDTFQYDGGIMIDSVHTDFKKASLRQQEMRQERSRDWAHMNPSFLNQSLETIVIQEYDLES